MAPLPWMHALLLSRGHRCGGQEVVVQQSPAVGIERHRAELRVLDEDAFLAAVHAIPALADSDSPRGSRKSPGTTRTVCSPRPMSSGSGAGSRSSCRSSSGSRGGTYTRSCSRFVMVPSGRLGPLHLPRCWSRWPVIPRWHSSVVGAGVGDLAAAVQPPTTDRRARRWPRTGPCRGQTLVGDACPGASRRRRCGGWSGGAALRRCCLAR